MFKDTVTKIKKKTNIAKISFRTSSPITIYVHIPMYITAKVVSATIKITTKNIPL